MHRVHPRLRFSEIDNEALQVLDYSGNWDIDGDGRKDSVLFIGNGGAHLYYHLRLRLSSEKKARDYDWLELDNPVLGTISELKKGYQEGNDPHFPQFVVHDFYRHGANEIYLCFDNKYSSIPASLRKSGLTSRHLLIKYENKHIVIKNFRIE